MAETTSRRRRSHAYRRRRVIASPPNLTGYTLIVDPINERRGYISNWGSAIFDVHSMNTSLIHTIISKFSYTFIVQRDIGESELLSRRPHIAPTAHVHRIVIHCLSTNRRKSHNHHVKPAILARFPRSFTDSADRETNPGRHSLTQNKPVIRPAPSTLIESAAGRRGNPGMVMISPHTTTRNSAPPASLISRIGTT